MPPHFHPLPATPAKPLKFNDPFCYEPHPLCLLAAEELQAYIAGDGRLRAEADRGKMFGVLVVDTADGQTGYLAAFSGLLGGTNDHAFFVPPVFDAAAPDGYFKTPEDEAAMTRESQFMKAEYKRLKRRCADEEAPVEAKAEAYAREISALKARRRQMSDGLQRWLFSQYSMLNARGERRDLCDIFAATPQRVPPAGAGDCCAPKLLQHAYLNGMRPVCMAEFWWGASPVGEVRHHLHYYPACRGKCLPILGHMLQGLEVEKGDYEAAVSRPLEIVYEDEWLAVVCKPAGMKSVPGKGGGTSVLEEMRLRRPDKPQAVPVHRLDMDTSGLLVVALDTETYKKLQAQFLRREVSKRYVALLDGVPDRPACGEISLPISPDPLDRPYQKVDFSGGKEALTEYRILETRDNMTRVALFPRTGRTHQLRLHCAHAAGLAAPILGDRLYGRGGGRLCLHAEALEFTHPVTGKRMKFERRAEF